MSIFKGVSALRTSYKTLSFVELAGASSQATALLWHTFIMGGRMTFIHNATDVEIAVYAVHPDAPPEDVDNRLLLFEVCDGQVLNYVSGMVPTLEFDPGSRLLAAWTTAAPTLGKLKLSSWG